MPILTKRSCTSTFQIVSARLSKNRTKISFAHGYFFSSTHFDLVSLMAQKVWWLFPCLASKIRSRSVWSLLLFKLSSILFTWASISSDESPCRTILIQFWGGWSHVFLTCTDFPRYHRMESLTSLVKLHPILHRIPEYYRYEEWQRKRRNPTLYLERQSLESSRR